ncbi:MAG TPA: TonB-dependent receptor [Cyclobacteriaceae bacterium]
MSQFYKKLSLLLLIFSCSFSYGQSNKTAFITGSFTNVPFENLVKAIEQQTHYKLFYNTTLFDSVVVNLTVDHKTVSEVLDLALQGTSFRYAISKQGNIYLVKDKSLQTSIPSDFFDRGQSHANETNNNALAEYLEREKKEKGKIFAENKQYDIGRKTSTFGTGTATLAGHVKSSETGEHVIGASVYVENPLIGISTDQFGYFAITLPKGSHELKIKSVGMKSTVRKINLYSDGKLDIELLEEVTSLKEVVIESEKDRNVNGMQMGLDRLDIKTMKKIPVALGEVDIFKVMLTLPGVQTVGEGTTGLNVRGGATNQNLILFNDATIYNPAHLFGFFSAFNPDIVKNVELYKSGIPAEYGGRLSSVVDVTSREGNKKKISGGGGLGPITSRLYVEGPIIKDKTSFLIGGRSTYSDWLLKKIPNDGIKHSKATFYDLNANINHDFNEKNSLYLSGYLSKDGFTLNGDTSYSYSNKAATIKWKHIFDNKLYGVVTGGYSGYDYKIESDKNPVTAYTLKYAIQQLNAKADFSYFPIPKHSLNFGVSAIKYNLSPGTFVGKGEKSAVADDILPKEQGLETALYLGDHYDISPSLSVYGGLRYSDYNFLGPHEKYIYSGEQTKTVQNITDTISYKSGKSIAQYQGPEYRVAVKYAFSNNASLKFSYNRTRQYIQMLSNTTAISPTDIWKLSDSYLKPQIGDQISLGLYKNLRGNTIETSAEWYYKTMQNSIDYKGGAKLILNHAIETDIIRAQGKAYGMELMIKKTSGKLNGWVTYTYSRSLLKTKSQYASETVNNGQYYPSNYDKPHAVNFIGNYKFSHRFSTSLNVTYSTGRPITVPIAKYYSDGAYRVFYGPRNGERIPDYFRIDFSMNIEGNHKIKKLAHSSWTVGVYNLTGRRNAYSVYFESKNGVISGHKLSILGSPIPTITYNFRF